MTLPYPSGDRVLVHLLQRASKGDPTSNPSDQETIALECSIGRTHVPRVLAPLLSDGFVAEGVGRAPGKPRRVKVYNLTAKGVETASIIFGRLGSERFSWTGPDGRLSEDRLADAARAINDGLMSARRPSIPLSVLISTAGSMNWNELMWLSASMGTETGKGCCLPKGYIPAFPPQPPPKLVGRAKEMSLLERSLKEDGFAVVTGGRGMGKRTLVLGYAMLRGLRVLWLAKAEGEEVVCLERDKYDLIVLEETGPFDLSGLLIAGGEMEMTDPRNGSWPDQLRSIPIIIVMRGEMKVRAPSMAIEGLPLEVFVYACAESGMSPKLSEAFHAACSGSPSGISYVRGLCRDEMESLASSGKDEALLRLLVGFNASLGPSRSEDGSKD